MTTKSFIRLMTEIGNEEIFRAARKVPADKLEWSPLDHGRSVLDQLQECSQSPDWCSGLMESRQMPDFNDEFIGAMMAERKQWTTIEECEAACKAKTAKLFEVLETFPESDLDATIQLPFLDRPMTYAELALIHYWNCTYHCGQINYIQTLYGDKTM